MNEIRTNDSRIDLRDMGGGGGNGGASPKNDSRDYGKYVIIATFVVLAAVAIVLAII